MAFNRSPIGKRPLASQGRRVLQSGASKSIALRRQALRRRLQAAKKPAVKKRNYSWNAVHSLVHRLARQVRREKHSALFGIPKNGLIVANLLSKATGIPVLHCTEKDLMARKNKKGILVVDDLIDSGGTLERFSKFDTAVLLNKGSQLKATYTGEHISKDWVSWPWEENEQGANHHAIRIAQHLGIDTHVKNPSKIAKRVITAARNEFTK